MSIIHSLRASAAFLSFCTLSQAWALHRKADTKVQEVDVGSPELKRNVHRAVNLGQRQEITLDCPNDNWQQLLDHNPNDRVVTFCNMWLGIAPATTVVRVTPTITITTSDATSATITSTQHVLTTETTTETATSTAPRLTSAVPLQPRAANAIAVAESIMSSVIASGTTSEPTTTKNEQRLQAESGLANACSCKMVEPTATVTSYFTVPPAYTTVGYRKLVITRVTETTIYTAYTTVTVTPGASSGVVSSQSTSTAEVSPGSGASNGTVDASNSAAPSNISATTGGEFSPVSPSAVPTTTSLFTASVVPSGTVGGNSSATENTIVTAIPFSCPEDASKRADQVVNDFRFEYLILCNTEIVTQDRVGKPIDTDSENECTAQCSVLNSASNQTTCQAAAFTPYTDGRPGGSCVISGPDPEYADKDGAITVVTTGISSNGDECAALNSTEYGGNSSVDTSALIASITTAPISIETPGLITQTADGGVFETYVSANSTDASGYVHWSWYRVSASSSYWMAVYGTSWACTKTLTQTIVQQPSTPTPIDATSIIVTTIINGATTTYISGSSTRTVVNGGGAVGPPTFVPASVTSGDGEITTFFSEATQTSTGDSGVIPPTNIPLNSTTSTQGSANVSVSFATSTIFSTASEGIIPPPASTSALPLQSSNSTGNITVIVSSGGSESSTSGSAFAANSTGDSGVIPPATSGSAAFTTSSATYTNFSTNGGGGYGPASSTTNWTYPPNSTILSISSGVANLTVGSSTFSANSTGDSGLIPPASITASTSVVSVTVVVSLNGTIPVSLTQPQPSNFSSGGSAGFTTSSATAFNSSTGSGGIVTPNPTSSAPSDTPSQFVSSGSANFTEGSSTFAANSTGTNGVIPPASSLTSSVPLTNTTSSATTDTPPANTSAPIILSTEGIASFSESGSTATTVNTSASGVIPPASGNITTATPSPSTGTNETVSSGALTVETSGSTAVIFSTGTGGFISPPSQNATSTVPTSFTPSPSLNATTSAPLSSSSIPPANETSILPLSSSPPAPSNGTTSLPVSSSPIPSANATTSLPVSSSAIPSLNATTSVFVNSTTQTVLVSTSTGYGPPPPDNSTIGSTATPVSNVTSTGGSASFTVENSTAIASSTGTGGIIPPTGNVSTSRGTPSFSATDRSPFPIPTPSGPSSGVFAPSSNGSFPSIPSGSPTPSLNSTTFVLPPVNVSITSQPSASPTPSLNSTTSSPFVNISISSFPSASPTPSLNSTIRTRTPFTNDGRDRTPFPIPTPSGPSSGGIIPSVNGSIPVVISTSTTTTTLGFSSGFPPASANVTTPPSPTGGSSTMPFFGNSTIPTGTGSTSASTSVPIQSLNSTIPSITPSPSINSTSLPSGVPTPSLNSTTSDICPTAPIIVTQTVSVATETQLVTTTVLQIETVTVVANSSGSPTTREAASSATPVIPADLEARFRIAGEPATQSQIDAACDDSKSIVLNPNFSKRDDGTVPYWTVDGKDPSIMVDSVPEPDGNGTNARFSSAVVYRTLTIKQPVTLCPGAQYKFSVRTRQGNTGANCNFDFVIAVGQERKTVMSIKPQVAQLTSSAFFTAWSGNDNAGAELRITGRCDGHMGAPVTDDEDGYMWAEAGAISLVKDT